MMGFMLIGTGVSFAEMKAGESIFEYKKELSLTDAQEKNLRDIIAKLQSYLADKQKEINVVRDELNELIARSADLNLIKAKVNAMAKIQAEAIYEDIASNRAIETELTGTQLSKWRSMQAEFARNLQQSQDAASKTERKTK